MRRSFEKGEPLFFHISGKNAEAENRLGGVSDVCKIPPLYIFNGDANELDPRIRGKSQTRDYIIHIGNGLARIHHVVNILINFIYEILRNDVNDLSSDNRVFIFRLNTFVLIRSNSVRVDQRTYKRIDFDSDNTKAIETRRGREAK